MNIKTYIGKYFGPFKIKEISLSKEKTYLGNDKVTIFFEDDDEQQDFPLKVLQDVISDVSIDMTELRERRVKPIVKEILIILAESELPNQDIAYATDSKLKLSIDDSFLKANKLLWKKENHEINLMDIEKILKNGQKNNN